MKKLSLSSAFYFLVEISDKIIRLNFIRYVFLIKIQEWLNAIELVSTFLFVAVAWIRVSFTHGWRYSG